MSLKGKVFTPADLPTRARLTQAEVEEWCAKQTERYRIVAMDGEYPVIAEELEERILRRLPPAVRIAAAQLVQQCPERVRADVLAAFNEDGTLKNPFQAT